MELWSLNKFLIHPILSRGKFFANFLKFKGTIESLEQQLSEIYGRTAILLTSARAGIYLGLLSRGFNRTDEILVPEFLSQCVLNTLNRSAFPSHSLSKKTKAVLVLHQWGYPQKMDEVMDLADEKKYFIIEDCAHSMTSKYKGKNIGLFGDVAVFSFPKVFPTVMGGFLLTDDSEIIEYARKFRDSKSALRNIFLNLILLIVYENQVRGEKNRPELLIELLEMCYSVYVNFPRVNGALLSMMAESLEIFRNLELRNRNLEIYKKHFPENYFENLEKDCMITPYLVPFFDSYDNLVKINDELKRNNVESSIMHFDVNKNLFDSDYVKCLALPCHQVLSQRDVEFVCNLVKTSKNRQIWGVQDHRL